MTKKPFKIFTKVSKSINNSAANSIVKPIFEQSIEALENLTLPKELQKKQPKKNQSTVFTQSNVNQTAGDFYSRKRKTKGGEIRGGGYKSIQDMEKHCS